MICKQIFLPIIMAVAATTTSSQSEPGSNVNDVISHNLHISKTGASQSEVV